MSRIQISPHCQLSPDWILKIIPYFEALGSRSSLIELLIIKSYGLTTIGSSSLNAAQLHSIERRPGVRQQRSTRPAKKRAGVTVGFENSTDYSNRKTTRFVYFRGRCQRRHAPPVSRPLPTTQRNAYSCPMSTNRNSTSKMLCTH